MIKYHHKTGQNFAVWSQCGGNTSLLPCFWKTLLHPSWLDKWNVFSFIQLDFLDSFNRGCKRLTTHNYQPQLWLRSLDFFVVFLAKVEERKHSWCQMTRSNWHKLRCTKLRGESQPCKCGEGICSSLWHFHFIFPAASFTSFISPSQTRVFRNVTLPHYVASLLLLPDSRLHFRVGEGESQ